MRRSRHRSTPKASSAAARRRMESTASRDTPCELAIRSALHGLGLRYRLHRRLLDLRRTADIVFSAARVAIFVDGCFWHGCPTHGTTPKANRVWWRKKINANRNRDLDTVSRLEAAGWVAIRVWEHEDPQAAAKSIALRVARRVTRIA
jgi:DNA mismatch endonuclease, patch repair protein